MADQKISDLVELLYNDVDEATDLLPIVDISGDETKKIKIEEIRKLITQKALELVVSLKIGAGAIVSDIKTDLTANSDNNLVTQKAIKTETDLAVKIVGAQTISGLKTFNTDGINLDGVDIKRDNAFYIGNDDAGSVIKAKFVSGTFETNSTILNIAHGISNLISSLKIRGLVIYGGFSSSLLRIPYFSGTQPPTYATFDNTQITIVRSATGSDPIGGALIFYV